MITKINKLVNMLTSKKMKLFDYISAFLVLIYSMYLFNIDQPYKIQLFAGIIALILAIIRPAELIKRKLIGKKI